MWQQLTADYLPLLLAGGFLISSVFLIKTLANNRRLKKSTKIQAGGNLNYMSSAQVNQLTEKIEKLEAAQKDTIQKHALVRFNPFEDTGGDQSFALALLDEKDNGIVISSLHSRGGTRVYAKQVVAAKASVHQFSKEEKEVVEKAAQKKG